MTKLFSNEDDQNTAKKLPGRNDFIIMKIAVESPQKMSDRDLEEVTTERHDGLLCKISNLHTLRKGGGGGGGGTPRKDDDEKISSVKSVPEENKHTKIL